MSDAAPSHDDRAQSCYTHSHTLPASPRQLPADLPDAILEEGLESGSDSANEPITPTTGRHSQEFTTLPSNDHSSYHSSHQGQHHNHHQLPIDNSSANATVKLCKSPFLSSQTPTPLQTATKPIDVPNPNPKAVEQDPQSPPLSRKSTNSSAPSFKRTMSNIFRRSNTQASITPVQQQQQPQDVSTPAAQPTAPKSVPNGNGTNQLRPTTSNQDPLKRLAQLSVNGSPPPGAKSRRFSWHRSNTSTRSNTPPEPSSPQEGSVNAPTSNPNEVILEDEASSGDFSADKKNRSATGLGLRGRAVNFVTHGGGARGVHPHRGARRANSFDSTKRPDSPYRPPQSVQNAENNQETYPPERLPWPLPPDAGTGAKARRMSLSLPDDFTVDVAELLSEFEYVSKFLGRHGKHLGKGAASKVTLMARKGYPGELYAVKEFRGKSNRESQEDYDKKIKSEFSIAKSLHHPNIVETVRLCNDHSRWNHVMEYCSEGDLFSLVSKGWLKGDDKKKDRLCLFKQLVQGVAYLHANGIAHRDIKLENLLITKESKLKITDFGVSEVFSGTHPGLREAGGMCGKNMADVRLCSPGICGSEPYIAPEVLAKKGDYDPRPLDVWSTAVVMIYLIFGGAIWTRAEPGVSKVYDNLVKGWSKWEKAHPPDATITDVDYPHCDALDIAVSPPALRRLMLQMLHPDPAKRISINDVITNRWMKNVECCQLESYDDPTQVIDASKKDATWNGYKKIYCHSHLPPKTTGSHSLGKMPGQAGY
jgi:protein-serine/threonine kinase